MLRSFFILLPCIFFIACGDKQADIIQGGSVVNQEQQELPSPQDGGIDAVVEDYQSTEQQSQQQVNQGDFKPIYFAFDSYALSNNMFAILDSNAEALKKNSQTNIVLEGNTDSYGSDEYNFALGNKRAIAVKEALIVRGIAKERIQTVSFGETKPVCTIDNKPKCRQENRRVDFAAKMR